MKIKYSFADWCSDNEQSFWIEMWDYDINDCGPKEVSAHSNKSFYFKCPRGLHESTTKSLNNISCGRTSHDAVCAKCKSIGQWMLDVCGDDAIEEYWSDKNDMSPFDVHRGSKNRIWFKCQNESHGDYLAPANSFYRGFRCPVCSNHKVVDGINSIKDTHPEYIKYFADQSDAAKYTVHSGKRVKMKCVRCGNIRESIIDDFFKHPTSCPVCGDGVSYAEKFVYEVLSQVTSKHNITFERQKYFDWSCNFMSGKEYCHKRIYDFFIDAEQPVIVEVHGEQHYSPSFQRYSSNARTLEDEQSNDELKMQMAIEHGVPRERYIVLDGRKPMPQNLRREIMQSNLPTILNFDDSCVDWNACGRKALDSYVVRTCDLWNSGIHDYDTLMSMTGLSRASISNYLQLGDEIGLCKYAPSLSKHLMCITNGIVFYSKYTCSHFSEKYFNNKILLSEIPSAQFNEVFSINGFDFKYIRWCDYDRILSSEPWRVLDDRTKKIS